MDEKGRGLVINPAYTKLTGLTEEDIIGKPATTDIVEGESMHMKVLRTRRAVRGIHMKIGQKRDVIVNVAPVIVDGILKGSVGVIRDVSEIQKLTNELNRARQIIRTLEAKYSFDDIVGNSDETTAAIEQAKLEQIHQQQCCYAVNLGLVKNCLHMQSIMEVIENTISSSV